MTADLDERIRNLFDGVAPVTADEARGRAAGLPARPRRTAARTALVVVLCLATLAGVLVAVTMRSPTHHATGPVSTTTTTPEPGKVFAETFDSPQVTVTDSGDYLAWWRSPPAQGLESALARVDLADGRLLARRDLGPVNVDQVLAAGSSLWVTTSSQAGREQLLRLDPATLRLEHRWVLSSGGYTDTANDMAVAGGGLWVASGARLSYFSLPSGHLVRTVSLPGAASSSVAADATGSALIVGEAAGNGRGAVQRRDPVTGSLLASRSVSGVAAPQLAVSGSAVWISEPTGMMGYVQLFSLATLSPVGPSCTDGRSTPSCIEGTNGIRAVIEAKRLWVSDPVGGSARNYCADPSNGRVLAALHFPQPQQDRFLAAAKGTVYYAAPAPRASEYVRRQAMQGSCATGS